MQDAATDLPVYKVLERGDAALFVHLTYAPSPGFGEEEINCVGIRNVDERSMAG